MTSYDDILKRMVRAALELGFSPRWVMERFGVSKNFIVKKVGWRIRPIKDWM